MGIFDGLEKRLSRTPYESLVKLAQKLKIKDVQKHDANELIISLVKRVGEIIQMKYKPMNDEQFKKIAAEVLDKILPDFDPKEKER